MTQVRFQTLERSQPEAVDFPVCSTYRRSAIGKYLRKVLFWGLRHQAAEYGPFLSLLVWWQYFLPDLVLGACFPSPGWVQGKQGPPDAECLAAQTFLELCMGTWMRTGRRCTSRFCLSDSDYTSEKMFQVLSEINFKKIFTWEAGEMVQHLLFFRKIQVKFPAPTWWLTSAYSPSSRE